jgi:hypothetical protein
MRAAEARFLFMLPSHAEWSNSLGGIVGDW